MGENQNQTAWRVPRAQTVIKAVAAAGFAALTALRLSDPGFLLFGALAAALAGLALRDLLAPVRVAADAGGVTVVTGFARRRHVPWPEVAAIKVDQTRRYGLRSRLLEIETVDDLHLFSRYDLGADPEDAAAVLTDLRAHEAGTESSR